MECNEITVDFPTEPTPEEVLHDLTAIHPEIYRAFEHGVFKARVHFDAEGITSREESAFSTLVRLHAKEYLRRKSLESVEIERVNLCGLWLNLGAYHIKMWKINEEGFETASVPASRLFQQYPLVSDGERLAPLDLAVYWRLDDHRNLTGIWLAYPRYYDDPRSFECYWMIPIPDPTLSLPAATLTEAGDLPIEPIVHLRTGTDDVEI